MKALDSLWKDGLLNWISQKETSVDISLVCGTVWIGDMDADGEGYKALSDLDGPSIQASNTRSTA